MTEAKVSILDGATFLVSDHHGDVGATAEEVEGLFHRDTRFLSRWILTVDGTRPDVLSVEHGSYFAAQFFLYPPTGTICEIPYLWVIRARASLRRRLLARRAGVLRRRARRGQGGGRHDHLERRARRSFFSG